MITEIYSFSFAAGQDKMLPNDCYIIDCRDLADPQGLGIGYSGEEYEVQNWIKQYSKGLVEQKLAEAIESEYTKIAFGCYAGKNRSVAMAEMLAMDLLLEFNATVEHFGLRDIWGYGV